MISTYGEAKSIGPYYIDSHIHLADPTYEDDLQQILKAAREVGVVAVVANSEDLDSSIATIELASKFPDIIYPAVGIHPWRASSLNPGEVEQLIAYIASVKDELAAIGEVGLDGMYKDSQSSTGSQIQVFHMMLNIASKMRLPVIIHSRMAVQSVLDCIGSYDLISVILHWYSGPVEFLNQMIQKSYYITFGPSLTYAKHIQNIAERVPMDLILTETDGPVQFRGIFKNVKTSPSLIPYVTEKLAEIKKSTVQELAAQILRNNVSAFPKLSSGLRSLLYL
ncbi:MAG: TatD family hydrolase [Candidatus Bathyarchaeia archaeon]